MAFSIGYVRLCDTGIHYLYTTSELKQPAKRKPRQYKPEFLREFDAQRRLRLKNQPFMEYLPKHDIEIPKAPAYRTIQRSEVDGIVNRLTMAPRDRFKFKHKDHLAYNDWQSAREEKIQNLRDTVKKFGTNRAAHSKNMYKANRKEKRHTKKHVEDSFPEI